MLIRVYGELWNPDIVNWGAKGPGNKGTLMGSIPKVKGPVDFWDARGIYVLYENFRAVYVGQTQGDSLGKRVRDHLTDRHAGRWDMFSWYSTSSIRKKKVRIAGGRHVPADVVINTLEALAIAISAAPLNRRYNAIPGARKAEQHGSSHPHAIRNYLENITAAVGRVEEMVEDL